jgi:hypothetical protein
MKAVMYACAVLSVLFAAFHVSFWWLFDWPSTLGYMTAEHRMLMQTYNLCMLPVFFFFCYCYWTMREELVSTRLGRGIMVMCSFIYLFRGIAELLFGNIRQGQSLCFCVVGIGVGGVFFAPVVMERLKRVGLSTPD